MPEGNEEQQVIDKTSIRRRTEELLGKKPETVETPEETPSEETPTAEVVDVAKPKTTIPRAYLKLAAQDGFSEDDFEGMTPSEVSAFVTNLPKAKKEAEATDGRKAVSGNEPTKTNQFTLPDLPELEDDGVIDPKLVEYAKAIKDKFSLGLKQVHDSAFKEVEQIKSQFSTVQQALQRQEAEKKLAQFDAEILRDPALKEIVGSASVFELDQTSAEYQNRELLIKGAVPFVQAGMTLSKAIKHVAEENFGQKLKEIREKQELVEREKIAKSVSQRPGQVGGSMRPSSSASARPEEPPATTLKELNEKNLRALKAQNGAATA